jgi:ribose 5-phosphate isomerase A
MENEKTSKNQSSILLNVKQTLGKMAAQLVKDGMIVGLGTGSTAECFIESLIVRCREGLNITAVASSEKSSEQATKGGIPVVDPNAVPSIDLTVDGADEVDPNKRLIKGRGGALLREKILARASEKMVVIVDEYKLVPCLGAGPLPVEIVYFGYLLTISHLKKIGYSGVIRKNSKGELYITDGGNVILDIYFEKPLNNPEEVELEICSIPGVVETGFFLNLADTILIGYVDGHSKTIN